MAINDSRHYEHFWSGMLLKKRSFCERLVHSSNFVLSFTWAVLLFSEAIRERRKTNRICVKQHPSLMTIWGNGGNELIRYEIIYSNM